MPKSANHWLLSIRPAFLASFLKRMLRIKRRVIKTDAGRFFVDPASHFGNAIICDGTYEPPMLDALTRLLAKGDFFLDVGANEGFFSIVASKLVGDYGTVVAIEPQSRLQGVIFRNLLENQAFNINVLQVAISDAPGIATLSLLSDMNTGGSGLFCTTRYRAPTEIVPQTTLSRLVELLRVDKIKLMKIDVEGFEYEAVLGSKEIFERGVVEHIALELHPSILGKRSRSQADIMEFLSQSGYAQNPAYRTLIMSRCL